MYAQKCSDMRGWMPTRAVNKTLSSNVSRRCSRLPQQHHLDTLALRSRDFPAQRGFQFSDLALAAFDHLFPQNQMVIANHTAPQGRQQPNTVMSRFNQLWSRYQWLCFGKPGRRRTNFDLERRCREADILVVATGVPVLRHMVSQRLWRESDLGLRTRAASIRATAPH
jgi:hypothetical protein